MNADDRPTLPEQYLHAMRSSHLQVSARSRGDVDYLIASGLVGRTPEEGGGDDWVRMRLGALLYRLAMEHDAARGEQSQACAGIAASTAAAEKLEKQGKRLRKAGKAEEAAQVATEAEAIRKEITRQLMSERIFYLQRLKSLPAAKVAVGEWALERAVATRYKSPGPLPTEADRIPAWRAALRAQAASVGGVAGRVLDVFLDNLCAHCQGRGFNGGFGIPQRICRECRGSGRRANNIGGEAVEAVEEAFGRRLLLEIDDLLRRVEREMRRQLAQQGA